MPDNHEFRPLQITFQVTPQRYWRVTHTDGRQWSVTFRLLNTVTGYYVVNRIGRYGISGAQLRQSGRLYHLVLNAVLGTDVSAPRMLITRRGLQLGLASTERFNQNA